MDLLTVAKKLGNNSSFGNEMLYHMCSDENTDLNNPGHLSDMMWLIGRAYAASPERRTYGYEKNADGTIKRTSQNKRIPLWQAKNSNDGKGEYFIFIAEYITKKSDFYQLRSIIDHIKNSSYKYNESNNDIDLLSKGIYAVYLYNKLIREASEEFDDLNDSKNIAAITAKAKGAHCKNQISFCSKFLHFHSPYIVFIIDQFSFDGGKKLIPHKSLSFSAKFEDFSKSLIPLDPLNLKDNYQNILTKVNEKLKDINPDLFGTDKISEDSEKISSYIEHCTRIYCIAKYLNDIKNQDDFIITPRLIDDLLLCIKK